jgi:hypothetical protein
LEPGVKVLRVDSIIEVEKVGEKALEKLKALVQDLEEPEEFMDLETYDFEFEIDDEEFKHL